MRSRPLRRRARGFTLVEMTISATLMVFVASLLASAWGAFGRPAVSALARARLAQEANLAAEAIARDVGLLARPAGPGADSRYQNVQAGGSTLSLSLDDGTGSVRTVVYSIDPDGAGTLLRTESGTSRVVARLFADFQSQSATLPVGPGGVGVPGVRIELTLRHKVYDRDRDGTFRGDHTRLYTLFVPDCP